jgi:hypothetical protein
VHPGTLQPGVQKGTGRKTEFVGTGAESLVIFGTTTFLPMKKLMMLFGLMILFPAFSSHIEQIVKTQIQVTIRNELGNTEEGVTVKLYENEKDYNEEKNAAAEGVTDAKGIVRFKDLKAISYFILAEKDGKNNFGGGEVTGKLEEKRINKVTVVIQ